LRSDYDGFPLNSAATGVEFRHPIAIFMGDLFAPKSAYRADKFGVPRMSLDDYLSKLLKD